MYAVPEKKPVFCNKCPFGSLNYRSFWNEKAYISDIDYESNEPNTQGYTCEIEEKLNPRDVKVERTKVGEDVPCPSYCKLKEHKTGYIVPMEMPKFCNKRKQDRCYFGHCSYSKPVWSKEVDIDYYDNKPNEANTYGYRCNIEIRRNPGHAPVERARRSEDIPRPSYCKLKYVNVIKWGFK